MKPRSTPVLHPVEPRSIELETTRYDSHPRDLKLREYDKDEIAEFEAAHPERLIAEAPKPVRAAQWIRAMPQRKKAQSPRRPCTPSTHEGEGRGWSKRRDITVEKIQELLASGESRASIARHFNVCRSVITKRLLDAKTRQPASSDTVTRDTKSAADEISHTRKTL